MHPDQAVPLRAKLVDALLHPLQDGFRVVCSYSEALKPHELGLFAADEVAQARDLGTNLFEAHREDRGVTPEQNKNILSESMAEISSCHRLIAE